MTTKGEWELIDMRAEKPVLLFLEGGWDNLIVYVGAILDLGGVTNGAFPLHGTARYGSESQCCSRVNKDVDPGICCTW